ncbi:MAG TPA: fused MFS/spermidine synthase, partial [Isosphaeraceae bacterium]|nr:fused MFS/spermidine synthase [Isosphaeraceae bacterium]
FLVLAILLTACGILARVLSRSGGAGPDAAAALAETPPAVGIRLRWLVLVFIPSSWLMGVTAYLTTDLAAIPLLWVIPLALYLSSFIIAFAGAGTALVRIASQALPVLVVPLVLVLTAGFVHAVWIPLHLLAFFAGSVACHGRLARLRPPARHLATFYVTIALGGLLGGVFNAVIAPVVFHRIVEYPLAVVLACMVAPGLEGRGERRAGRPWLSDLLLPVVVFLLAALLTTNQAGLADSVMGVLGVMIASGLGLYACATARRRPARFAMVAGAVLVAGGLSQGPGGRLLHIERNFFGVVRVTEDSERKVHRLFHGSTLHGQQSLDPALSREPSTYFTRSGPIGQVFAALGPRLDRAGAQVAIVGLGAGTLATYARPGQRWTFYEIDPAVVRIARDPRFFTYLRDCAAASLEIVLGDARLRLRAAPDRAYRLIVLDAFSSDAVPVHLVSREAIRLYRGKLAAGGVLVFNLSNRYLDLEPVMGRQAQDAGLVCRIQLDTTLSPEERHAGKQPSIWAVMAASADDLEGLASDPRWRLPVLRPNSRAWTDDYSDLARYLRGMPRRLVQRESTAGPSAVTEGGLPR